MGNRKNGFITENRVYTDPANPATSDYDAIYPVTLTSAVIDTASGQSLETRLASMGNNAEIEDLSSKVGKSTDTANSSGSTIFSILKWIANKFVNTWTDTRATKLDNIDTTVSSRASQASIDSLSAQISQGSGSSSGATQTSVDAISSKIGASADAANASGTTLFALIKRLVADWTTTKSGYVDASISTRASQTTVDTVSTKIGTSSDTASSSGTTLFALIKRLVTDWTTAKAGYLDAAVTSRASQASVDAISTKLDDSTIRSTRPVFASKSLSSSEEYTPVNITSGRGYVNAIFVNNGQSFVPTGVSFIIDGETYPFLVGGYSSLGSSPVVIPIHARFNTSLKIIYKCGTSGIVFGVSYSIDI